MEILRSKYGIKIGSSTGYTKEIMEMLKVRFAPVYRMIRSQSFKLSLIAK